MTGPNSPDDDRVDEMLIQGARDYNQPGAVPREEIWAKISEARRAKSDAPTGPAGSANPPLRATRRIWIGTGIGIAAALLISTGIVIGRRMNGIGDGSGASIPAPARQTARGPAEATAKPGSTSGNPRSSGSDTLQAQAQEETRRTNGAARALAALPSNDTATSADAISDMQRSRALSYQLVVMRHLAGTEAMITSFQSSARRGVRDSTMAEWSRELLGTTRTLEAARATNDPVMRRLLDDLDLVLTQIVQYTTKGKYDPDELDLIDQSINRRGVITKLRSNLPTRQMPVGT